VAIDLHGSEDRAKDVSSAGARDGSSILRPVHAWRCTDADSVPFLGDLGASDVIGRVAGKGGTRTNRRTDLRPAFRREPAKDHDIRQTGTPSTVSNAGSETAWIAPHCHVPRRSLAHAAHTSSAREEML
jgi:hypothetical protein